MKDLKITSFSVTGGAKDECYLVTFSYTCATGAGTCGGYPCEDESAVMDCVKQLLNNIWPE